MTRPDLLSLTVPPNPTDRTATLLSRRALKMARSAHAFVRGSTEQFYQWIASASGIHLPRGPSVWICGDCHVGNLGPIGHPEGKAVVEIRDLDQTVVGNPAHDLVRLALSLAMAARSSDLPGVTTSRITEDLVAGYESAFEGAEVSEAIDDLPDPIRVVMKRAMRRTWRRLFEDRLGKRRAALQFGARFWPLTEEERAAVKDAVETEPVRRLVSSIASRKDVARVSFVDAAFWVKGCSSLGLWRAAALLELHSAPSKARPKRSFCLLDLKQAVDASAPWAKDAALDLDPAERVLEGAARLAPALGGRMLAARVLDRSVFLRELLPQDLKVELDRISVEQGRAVAFYLGMVVGRAHGRQMDGPARRSWYAEMVNHRSKSIEAPGWMWASLIDLVALHERAYLEHCRRHALALERLRESGAGAVALKVPPALDPMVEVRRDGAYTASAAAAAGAADAGS
ncbi:MAG: DUF2252 family protein [Polyangiaceae bacterium]